MPIADVAVPMDHNFVFKIREKLKNYCDLELEVQTCWDLQTVKTVSIIIGALGIVCGKLQESLHLLSPRIKLLVIQKLALLGTSRTLRTCLTPEALYLKVPLP